MRKAIPAAMIGGLMFVACARQARIESGGEVDLPGTVPVDAARPAKWER